MVDFTALLAKKKAEREAQGGVITPAPVASATTETPKPNNFLQQLAAKAASKAADIQPIGVPEVAPIPKVISAANLAAKATEGQAEAEVAGDTKVALDNIRQKIHDIQEMNGGELSGAMTTLREMLRANPAACSLMLPEDMGLMVRALRKMTNNTQALSMGAAKTSKKPGKEKELSVEEVLALAAENGTDGWD